MQTDIPLPADPDHRTLAEAHFGAGVRDLAAGRTDAARTRFERALQAWPGCAAAWVNLGLMQEDGAAFGAAVASFEHALALEPGLFEAALNLGALLARLKRCDEAEIVLRRALRLRPDAPAVWSNLGALLAGMRRDADAEACCRQALALDPRHDKARFNLSYPLLRQGRLEEGFLCMEARESSSKLQRQIDAPRWLGDDLAGRALLLVSDAGHGDAIQMARYARQLKGAGASRVVFCGQPALKRLLARVAGFDRVTGCDEPLDDLRCDVWAPMMSLPHLLRTRLDTLPGELPYLRAEPARVAHWRRLLAARGSAADLRVGLVWRGNPRHENDAERSLPHLGTLAPLAGIAGVRYFSLQSGAGAADADRPASGLVLETLGAPLGDFAETAAIVANLDLVIGVDTSVVHLAGAMGKPVWVLVSDYKPDWRWLDGRDDSPWYPGVMRLFRQTGAGRWETVIADLVRALQSRVEDRTRRLRTRDPKAASARAARRRPVPARPV